MASPLTLSVFTAPTRPVIRARQPPAPPGGWTWPPTSASLIEGEREAILVDALTSMSDARNLADWIEAKGKILTTIYITHDHADHYLGAPVLLQRFPKARLVAEPKVVEDIRPQFSNGSFEKYWRPLFNGDIANGQVIPAPLADNHLELEGHEVVAHQTGQSDTVDSTYIHVPELDAIVAGDIVYNDVHQHLGATDHAKRQRWLGTLEELAALRPKIVVAGHRRLDAPDGPETIAETARYIRDLDAIVEAGTSVEALIEKMLSRYPKRLNITTLYNTAYLLLLPPQSPS